MERRGLLAAGAGGFAATAAGCLGLGGTDPGRLDLTVRNDGDDPVDVDVAVEGADGGTDAVESDRVDAGVARTFEVPVGASGRHEAAVTAADWEGRLAWDAGTCRVYEGLVAVDDAAVEVAGECGEPR